MGFIKKTSKVRNTEVDLSVFEIKRDPVENEPGVYDIKFEIHWYPKATTQEAVADKLLGDTERWPNIIEAEIRTDPNGEILITSLESTFRWIISRMKEEAPSDPI